MSEEGEPEETVEVVVDLKVEAGTNPMADLLAQVPAVANMPMDLTKDEKLRTTALMLAIRYHADTVVKEGELYQQMKMDQKMLTPTSAPLVIEYAWHFEKYLRGESEVVAELEDKFMAYLEKRLAEMPEEEEEAGATTPSAGP